MAIAKPGYDIDRSINLGHAERLASLVGGVLLGVMGFRRGTVVGAAIAMAGGALVVRGLTGYCPMYNAMSMSTAERQRALEPPPSDDAVLAVDIVPLAEAARHDAG
ncbi:MAG TPA: DUF2892 domain-containing protein [Azospirillaceae bacterium]|nr:DUF2892 domain-containing protein [Azospirillaceae bacterium]